MPAATFKTLGVWTLCLSGSAILQIWPRVQGVLWPTPGLPEPSITGEAGWIAIQVIVLVVMAGIPKAVESAEGLGKKAIGWLLGIAFFLFSVYLCQEGVNHLKELITGPRQGVQAEAARLDGLINRTKVQRQGVGEHERTTEAMVSRLAAALADAKKTREQECEKLGPNCRKRQDEEGAANKAVTEAERHQGLTARADKLDDDLTKYESARAALIVPKDADVSAARTAQITGLTADQIADWFPVFVAMLFELLAFLGPWLLDGKKREVKAQVAPATEADRAETIAPAPAPAAPAPSQGVVSGGHGRGSKAKAVTTRKPSRPTVQVVADPSTVREWHAQCVGAHGGGRYQSSEAFRLYGEWCEARGDKPVNIKVWGTMMKDELKVRHEKDSSDRTFYLDIRIASRPKLVAAK